MSNYFDRCVNRTSAINELTEKVLLDCFTKLFLSIRILIIKHVPGDQMTKMEIKAVIETDFRVKTQSQNLTVNNGIRSYDSSTQNSTFKIVFKKIILFLENSISI